MTAKNKNKPKSSPPGAKNTPPGGAGKTTPPGEGIPNKNQAADKRLIKDMAHEIIANSLAKEAHGELLRWRWEEAQLQIVVLLKDGRKIYGQLKR